MLLVIASIQFIGHVFRKCLECLYSEEKRCRASTLGVWDQKGLEKCATASVCLVLLSKSCGGDDRTNEILSPYLHFNRSLNQNSKFSSQKKITSPRLAGRPWRPPALAACRVHIFHIITCAYPLRICCLAFIVIQRLQPSLSHHLPMLFCSNPSAFPYYFATDISHLPILSTCRFNYGSQHHSDRICFFFFITMDTHVSSVLQYFEYF